MMEKVGGFMFVVGVDFSLKGGCWRMGPLDFYMGWVLRAGAQAVVHGKLSLLLGLLRAD